MSARYCRLGEPAMISAQLAGDNLEILLTGKDGFSLSWKTRWALQVPLGDVVSATTTGRPFDLARRTLNGPASERRGETGILVCAHRGAPTLELEISTPPYRRIVLGVPDPEGTAQVIKAALASRAR
jgi:hypothetical protein